MSDSIPTCRICLDTDEEESALISPCSCIGSSEFVHNHCLIKWVETSGQTTCWLCKKNYAKESKPKPLRLFSDDQFELLLMGTALAVFLWPCAIFFIYLGYKKLYDHNQEVTFVQKGKKINEETIV